MKWVNKIFKYVIIIIVLLILCRGFIYKLLVNYSVINFRDNIVLIDDILIEEIDKKTNNKLLSIEDIIEISKDLTSEKLKFTFNKTSSNPNKISTLNKANCIGYASLFNSIGNYLINKNELDTKYEFNHLVGKLDVLGHDIHTLFNSPFFKDHDFNEIKNIETGESLFLDPSLNDYFKIDSVTSKKVSR